MSFTEKIILSHRIAFCCCCSITKLCPALWDHIDSSIPGFLVPHISQSLPKIMSIESVMPSTRLILCHPSVFPSIRVFSSESAVFIRWPKCWSFSFSISPSKEYSGLVSLRIDWFDLLAFQGSLKSLLQHHSLKVSILQCSDFFYCPALTSIHDYWKDHAAAAAAKSLQLCPTLCDPIDGSPPGSPVPGILQARTLEWVAISFSNVWKWSESEVAQSCPTCSDPMDCCLPGSSVHRIF